MRDRIGTVAVIQPDEAEAKAAEIRQKIAGHDAFLAAADGLIEAAARSEARLGKKESKFSEARRLQKRKVDAQDELSILRGRLRGYEEIVAEHQAEVAAARRAEVVSGLRRLTLTKRREAMR